MTAGSGSAFRQVERCVFGSDHGADGYTTLAQADELARRLNLRAGDRLLDLGSGSGWPALHLAQTTGARVIMSDRPLAGLRAARDRAAREGLSDRCDVVAACGPQLPFRPASFDAVTHADVLC